MREIKFRAFHKKQNKYIDFDIIDFNQRFIGIEGIDRGSVTNWISFDEIILEQYTGLNDKGGAFIYEGDIVKMDGLNYLIKWDNDGGRWVMSTEKDWMDYLLFNKNKIRSITIVGNVNAHANLLKEEIE